MITDNAALGFLVSFD